MCRAVATTRPSASYRVLAVNDLRPSVDEVPADDHVRLAHDRERVDAGGHPAQHAGPALEVLRPAADAVQRRPGDARAAALDAVDQVSGLGVLGVRDPQRGDVPAVAGRAADRAGEDPQAVALGAVRPAGEAGREGVVAEAGVAEHRGGGDVRRDLVDRVQLEVDDPGRRHRTGLVGAAW